MRAPVKIADRSPVFGCRSVDPTAVVSVNYFASAMDAAERSFAKAVFENAAGGGEAIAYIDGRQWIFHNETSEAKLVSEFGAATPEELALKLSLAGGFLV